MLRPDPNTRKTVLALGAALLAGCVESGHSHYPPPPPQLVESEPNDGACCADPFGVLAPGAFLAIHGFIDDSGFDPFDGFAFTAWEPISVEFRLYADQPGADLDVCLYDPQLDLTVDCFQSPFNPETGTVNVFAGGADFHLVVSSFLGASPYTLELEVFPLYLADAPALAQGTLAAGARAADQKPDRRADFEGYRLAPPARRSEPVLLLDAREIFLLDLESGVTTTAFCAQTSEGTQVWMGNPDEAHAQEDP